MQKNLLAVILCGIVYFFRGNSSTQISGMVEITAVSLQSYTVGKTTVPAVVISRTKEWYSMNPVFVIGHRNPDTDSICSAISVMQSLSTG